MIFWTCTYTSPLKCTAFASSGGVLQCLLHSPLDSEHAADVVRIPFFNRLHSLTSNLRFNALLKDSSAHWLQGLGTELPIFQLDDPLYQLIHGWGICYFFNPIPIFIFVGVQNRFVIDSVDCINQQAGQCWISCDIISILLFLQPPKKFCPMKVLFFTQRLR